MTIVLTIIVYVAVAVVVAVGAAFIGTDPRESRRARRNAARVGLLAVFWPALVIYVAVVGFVKAWRLAEWGAR